MTMNRNDFAALAEFAKSWRDGIERLCSANYVSFCNDLVDTCQARAPDFNRERFLNACETPLCPYHRRRSCVENSMGVLWCSVENKSAEVEE